MSGFLEQHIFIACLPFAVMGALFHMLNNMEETKVFVAELRHPTPSGNQRNDWAFYGLVFFCGSIILAAVGYGMTGSYRVAALLFITSWLQATLAAWFGFAVFSKLARAVWTTLVSLLAAALLFFSYLFTCPTLTISPTSAKFSAVGELYSFRVENKSDRDTYMNSFVFYLDSEAYSANDFDFQIEPDSLKPLAQQLDGVDYGVPDIFGVLGFLPDLLSRRFFLVNVYHLAPHESRQVSIKLKQYEMSTNQIVPLSAEVMSYTEKQVPVTKDGIVVYVPALIKRRLALTNFLVCYLKQGTRIPCTVRPSNKAPLIVAPQCVSLAVVSEKEPIPQKILAGKCEP